MGNYYDYSGSFGFPWPQRETKNSVAEPTPGVGAKPSSALNHVVVPPGFGVRWQLDENGWAVGFELVSGKVAGA